MSERIFVFTESTRQMNTHGATRPRMYAFRESEIAEVMTQWGSQNSYLKVNGIEVEGSFDQLVKLLGERVDIK